MTSSAPPTNAPSAPTGPSPAGAARSFTGGLARRLPPWLSATIGVVSLVVAVAAVAGAADGDAVARTAEAMAARPAEVLAALAAFALAFVVRAWVWCRVLPSLPFGHALAGVNLSLGANHVLPLRLGEPFRVLSVVRRADVPLESATASSVVLRAADILAVVVLGAVAGPQVFVRVVGAWGWAVFALVAAVGAAAGWWLVRLRRRAEDPIRLPGPAVAAGTLVAWLLEAVLVWRCAAFAGIDLSFSGALLVTCAAVAAQTVAIAPSGIGTYEAASVAAYVALGHDARVGLAAAIGAHALKTAYSLLGGAVAVALPAPGMLGRFRLARRTPAPPAAPVPPPDAPVVLFLPAHDEEATVAAVVRRAPARVCGRRVEVVVVDDGSTDATAARAAEAGATVVSLGRNQGLGAAVREGFARAVGAGAAAVAFCDADGEYAPEELERLVAPILAGEADYVVGSRFAGTIHHMRPHRRLGNTALTRALSFVAGRRITDGQSGYRALSAAAAANAEIVHDFNYAQVLTLDLLGKGFRYHEVPISYRFRQHGRSFVRLGRYLRAVGPAVYRELNAA